MVFEDTDKWCFLAKSGIGPKNASLFLSVVHGPIWYYIYYRGSTRDADVYDVHIKSAPSSSIVDGTYGIVYISRLHCVFSHIEPHEHCWMVLFNSFVLKRMYAISGLCLGFLFCSQCVCFFYCAC